MKNRNGFEEKREYPRISRRLTFEIQTEDAVISAETINLSCSGVCCRVSKHIPPMTNLRIVLALIYDNTATQVEYVECEGMVVRVEAVSSSDSLYNIAIFFNEIEESEREKIMDFIEAHLEA